MTLRFLDRLRSITGRDDPDVAFRAETRAVREAAEVPSVDPRFRQEMEGLAREHGRALRIGTAAADPSVPVLLPFPDVAGQGHGLVLGGSGSGKTRAVAGIARGVLRRIATQPDSMGMWIIDHKSEFVGLTRELIADLVDELPSAQANRLLDRLVVIDPFSTSALVPMQILKPELGIAPELQAFEVTTLIDRLGGAGLGVRQDTFTFHMVLLGISRGLSLPELAALTGNPLELVSFASGSPNAEVRSYFGGGNRIAAASLEGVRARLSKLLRLPSNRLMLGAKESISFGRLLEDKIVLVDTGSPPLGCEDLGRFWSGLATLKFARAVFGRSPDDARRSVAVFVDEWQEGLAGGGDMADNYERILSMARSRGVSMWLISQSLAGAAKVSSSLPKVVATNTNIQMLFRASMEDARAMVHLLPVCGRRPRQAAAPWDRGAGSPFLSAQEELQLAVNGVTSLPDRTFYLWNRRRAYRAELVRATDVSPRDHPFLDSNLGKRLREGTSAVPIEELQLQLQGDANGHQDPEVFAPIAPRRRPGAAR